MTTVKKDALVLSSVINAELGTITFTVRGIGDILFDINKVSSENRAYAALHGFKQRLADNAALSRNPETGLSATAQEKYDAIAELAEHYMSGASEWSVRREGSGPRVGILLACLMELSPGKTETELREWLKGKTKADQAVLLASPKIAPIADAIRAKAVKASGIDVDALLEELA